MDEIEDADALLTHFFGSETLTWDLLRSLTRVAAKPEELHVAESQNLTSSSDILRPRLSVWQELPFGRSRQMAAVTVASFAIFDICSVAESPNGNRSWNLK